MDYVIWLLATSGILQQLPPVQATPDTGSAAVAGAVARRGLAVAPIAAVLRDSAPGAGPLAPAPWPRLVPDLVAADSAEPQRPRAIEMSEAYHTRLMIHYVASFAILPLFAAQYALGTKLYNDPPGSLATRQAHTAVALGVATLFTVNGVTGAWNLWESRKAPGGLRRYLHAGLMLAAEGGFVATGLTAPRGSRIYSATPADRRRHRTLALASMGTALASYAMMLVWRN